MAQAMQLLPVEKTSLYSIVIHLGAAASGRLPQSCNRAIHAQVLDWMRYSDAELAQRTHDSQVSSLSLSGLLVKRFGKKWYCHPKQIEEGEDCYIRVGILDGMLLNPLLLGVEQQGDRSFELAQFPFVVKGIKMLPGSHQFVDVSSYADLVENYSRREMLTIHFLSPTSFRLRRSQGVQLLPLSKSVFGGLQHRWNRLAPDNLRFSNIECNGLIVDYDLKVQSVHLQNSRERGFVGWVSYQFTDKRQAQIAQTLSHFACFAGIGRKTTMGMGMVTLNES